MTEKTKHEFVDDNPYLVYSGDIDASYSGDSGSGGGGGGDAGSGVFWVEITGNSKNPDEWANNPATDETATTDFTLSATVNEITEAINAGKIVKVIAEGEIGNFVFDMSSYTINPDDGTLIATFISLNVWVDGDTLNITSHILNVVNINNVYRNFGKKLTTNVEPNPPIQTP